MKRKARTLIPKYLKEEEIQRLFAVIKSKRDTAIFRLVYHRGLRASEVGLLNLDDWRRQANRLLVRRLKGSMTGEYPLLPVEIASLRAWLRERGNEPGALFPSRNNRPISRFMLDKLMRRYGKLAAIPRERCHMHALKHSCGTHLASQGEDLLMIRDWLGHVSVASTEIYVSMAGRKLEEAAARQKNWGR